MPMRSGLGKFAAGLPEAARESARRVAEETALLAKAFAPVLTGSLESTIQVEQGRSPAGQFTSSFLVTAGGPTELTTATKTWSTGHGAAPPGRTIFHTVFYAAYQEFGTRWNVPVPYMKEAAEAVYPSIEIIARSEIDKLAAVCSV